MENQNKEEQIIHGRTDKFTAQILSFSQHVRGGLLFQIQKPPDITALDDHQKAISIFYRTAIISNITISTLPKPTTPLYQ